MPWLHRRVGNPLLTGILNAFTRTRVSDAHCGMRAFRRSLLPRLDLQATGMELASEHLIRSARLGLDIREIPIDYSARIGESKLETFADGWRHLRLLLVHSPTWLFLIPGAILTVLGIVTGGLALSPALDESRQLHGLIVAGLLAIVGCQVLQFGVFARSFAAWQLGGRDLLFERVRRLISLESLLLAGAAVALAGFVLLAVVGVDLARGSFDGLADEKLAVVGLTVFVVGVQVVFASFLLSVLGLRRRRSETLSRWLLSPTTAPRRPNRCPWASSARSGSGYAALAARSRRGSSGASARSMARRRSPAARKLGERESSVRPAGEQLAGGRCGVERDQLQLGQHAGEAGAGPGAAGVAAGPAEGTLELCRRGAFGKLAERAVGLRRGPGAGRAPRARPRARTPPSAGPHARCALGAAPSRIAQSARRRVERHQVVEAGGRRRPVGDARP